jgi:trigger factor
LVYNLKINIYFPEEKTMSLIKVELTEKSGFVMEFSVSKEVYDKAELAAYKKNVKNINVPGFRKGKAPKAVVEKFYGKGIFFEDAINACIPEAYEAAVKEAGIEVVGNPPLISYLTRVTLYLRQRALLSP